MKPSLFKALHNSIYRQEKAIIMKSMSKSSPNIDEVDIDLDDDDVDVAPKILWSCVQRNGVILAEASDTDFIALDAVAQTARELLKRKATPGFEFHTQSRGFTLHNRERRLKGIKFHVYEHCTEQEAELSSSSEAAPDWMEDGEARPDLRVWVFNAVFDPDVCTRSEVQSFLEKMVTLTENFREHEPEWKTAGTLELQPTFAPILKQRMQQVSYLHELSVLDGKIQACQEQMERNITAILERGEDLDALKEDATRMEEMAGVFKKRAKKVKRLQMLQNAKHGLVLGSIVTAGVATVTVPALVAIL